MNLLKNLASSAQDALQSARAHAGASAHSGAEAQLCPAAIEKLVHDEFLREAGVDFDARPILVASACVLPPPQTADYDILLAAIRSRLETFVESDYVIVLFAAPLHTRPSWAWLLKAYRSLGRAYKKHLKRLYVVHPSPFTRWLLRAMGPVVSPKFAAKIVCVATLSELSALVPFHQLPVPEPVYSHNLNYETQLRLAAPPNAAATGLVFARPLASVPMASGLPALVVEATAYLGQPAHLAVEGLFRRSPSSNALLVGKDAFDRGLSAQFDILGGPHVAAALLKVFLRLLPKPLLDEPVYPALRAIHTTAVAPGGAPDGIDKLVRQQLFPLLAADEQRLLAHLFSFLRRVHDASARNRMTAHNLAIVFAPNLVRSANPIADLLMVAAGAPAFFVIRACIEHWEPLS